MLKLPLSSEDFWHYSVTVYAQEPVKDACLDLQDEFAANVNIILLCMLFDRSGLSLMDSELSALVDGIAAGETKLCRLRAKRRAIKSMFDLPVAEMHAKYQQAFSEELQMERNQQQTLVRLVNDLYLNTEFTSAPNSSLHNYLHLINGSSDKLSEISTETLHPHLKRRLVTLSEYV